MLEAVFMGVSGCGKSTVGEALAARLGWRFIHGDALHPPANVAKMHAGQPLDDDDRWPWFDAWSKRGTPGIITCSALKRRYRERIIGERGWVRLVYLEGPREVIAERLAARTFHPDEPARRQFAALEPPAADEHAIVVGIDRRGRGGCRGHRHRAVILFGKHIVGDVTTAFCDFVPYKELLASFGFTGDRPRGRHVRQPRPQERQPWQIRSESSTNTANRYGSISSAASCCGRVPLRA